LSAALASYRLNPAEWGDSGLLSRYRQRLCGYFDMPVLVTKDRRRDSFVPWHALLTVSSCFHNKTAAILMKIPSLFKLAVLPALLVPGLALATNGYFSHGYGVKSQGLAGVGIALPQDGLVAASNPAGTAFVGNRLDLGVTWFRPDRGSEISGNGAGLNGIYDGNDSRNFFIPEIGYVQQINPQFAAGIAVYGNGGMNTDYGSNPFLAFGATGSAGVNLVQLFISP